jgi:hypothetical protein
MTRQQQVISWLNNPRESDRYSQTKNLMKSSEYTDKAAVMFPDITSGDFVLISVIAAGV